MCVYKLELSSNLHGCLTVNLHIKSAEDLLNDYYAKSDENSVYNDDIYKIRVINEDNLFVPVDILFINNERVETGQNIRLFLECFGVVKIEAIINGIAYISENIKVMISKSHVCQNIVNMIDFIYENCDEYLYEEHKYSKVSAGILPNTHISLDSKLALLKTIYMSYIDCYRIFRYSNQTKLVSKNKIGSFSELQTIQPKTIEYISTHPDELQAVSYNSGILVNKQYFQPNRTLVQAVAYSSDTYENRVVIGFIKTVINELNEIKKHLNELKKSNLLPKEKDGYVDSIYYIYTHNSKMLDAYLDTVSLLVSKFGRLYTEYSKIISVSDAIVISPPKYTMTFRSVMPYKIIFSRITEWFKCGKYDIEKNKLLLSFISVSKIYEYYCLLKLIRAFEKSGYLHENSIAYKYDKTKYYSNTTYNNTFQLSKGDLSTTIYFQPVIYGKYSTKERPNNIRLFRNTSISISKENLLSVSDDEPAIEGNIYTPDYVIRIENMKKVYYYILDAKHSTPNTIKRLQLPQLVYKYLFSISALSSEASLNGMYIFCGKSDSNSNKYDENLHNIANEEKISILPEAHLIKLTGENVTFDDQIIDLIRDIEQHIAK